MNVAVIGSGNIGGTLAKKWAAAGHDVSLGVRDPGKPDVVDLVRAMGGRSRAATASDATAEAEVVVFAIPGEAVGGTLAGIGPRLGGKVIVDATNNMGGGPMNSLATIASAAPGAHVYRAFNSLGWENFQDTTFKGVQGDLFYAGPEGPSQATVERLISDVGLRPIRVGGADQAGLVDSVTGLWFALAIGQGMGRRLAFKVLTP